MSAVEPTEISHRSVRGANTLFIAILALGLLLRIALALISDGTDDAVIWYDLATRISQIGLLETYRTTQLLNHPPLAALWSRVALASGLWFSFVMKIPALLGDLLAMLLLWKIAFETPRNSRRASFFVAAMSFSPLAIILSGYHCNTDSLYAALSLLAMYFLAEPRRDFFLAGLSLGAAINVKLIPLLLVPGALAQCVDRRDLARLIGGLAIMTLPFVPLVLFARRGFAANVLGYVPEFFPWGVNYLLDRFEFHSAILTYRSLGRWLIAGAAILLAVISRRWRKFSSFELGAIVYLSFLIFTPGFGCQYLAIILPLLIAASPRIAWIYSVIGGAFLSRIYFFSLINDPVNPSKIRFPLLTILPRTEQMPGTFLGLLTWCVLLVALLKLLMKRIESRPAVIGVE